MVRNFRYEEPGAVALSGAPETPEAVDWLHDQGIRTVVSLHPVSDAVRARLAERGMDWRPAYVTDFAAGVPPEFTAALAAIRGRVEEEPAALIH